MMYCHEGSKVRDDGFLFEVQKLGDALEKERQVYAGINLYSRTQVITETSKYLEMTVTVFLMKLIANDFC